MRYTIRRRGDAPGLIYEPVPGLIVGATAQDLVSAADRGAALVEALGTSPLGIAIPQLGAAAAAAKAGRLAIKAAKAGKLDEHIRSLSDRTAQQVTSFLRSIF